MKISKKHLIGYSLTILLTALVVYFKGPKDTIIKKELVFQEMIVYKNQSGTKSKLTKPNGEILETETFSNTELTKSTKLS